VDQCCLAAHPCLAQPGL